MLFVSSPRVFVLVRRGLLGLGGVHKITVIKINGYHFFKSLVKLVHPLLGANQELRPIFCGLVHKTWQFTLQASLVITESLATMIQ